LALLLPEVAPPAIGADDAEEKGRRWILGVDAGCRNLTNREDTAVAERYDSAIEKVTRILADTVLSVEEEGLLAPLELDATLREVLRRIGRGVLQEVLETLSTEVVAQAEAADPALARHRRSALSMDTLFGAVEVESPYLWRAGRGVRPVENELQLGAHKRSVAVERALCDFGAEESFGQAVVRFEEHYGWTIGRTSALKLVENRAREAEQYVAERLAKEAAAFDEAIGVRPGVDEMLAELDGCEIRTGTLVPVETDEKTPVRNQPKRKRIEEWRDVRVGLCRRLDEVERTYVAKMDPYPIVVGQLFQAAIGRGLSSRTTTVAVADGGNGLREELAAHFPNLRFIYDRPHLKQHLYETAETIGLKEVDRHRWVDAKMERLEKGRSDAVVIELDAHRGRGKKRVQALRKHLARFADAVHYEAYREAGWPTGSGEIESAHRYIPQKRLKLPGASWKASTVNPMLALRVVRANGWWGDFWQQQRQKVAA